MADHEHTQEDPDEAAVAELSDEELDVVSGGNASAAMPELGQG